ELDRCGSASRCPVDCARPWSGEIGERRFLELCDKAHIRVVLNAHVSWVERCDSVRVGSGHDEKRSDGEDQPERQREDEHRGSLFPTSNESAGDMPMRARGGLSGERWDIKRL